MVVLKALHEAKVPRQICEVLKIRWKQARDKFGFFGNFNEEKPCICLQLRNSGIDSYKNQTTMTTANIRKCSAE